MATAENVRIDSNLEANYEYIWTSYWWFDDFQLVNDSYAVFEKQALQSEHTKNLSFLSNLLFKSSSLPLFMGTCRARTAVSTSAPQHVAASIGVNGDGH